ncbi:MAG: dihydroneopterin aldolase [Paenibacillaceae bacterium]|nr:dihydroneopterin aldolase [Paenibacillaceae bacterium]
MDKPNKPDKISLSRMQFYAHHGVFPEENKLGQRYMLDLDLYLPLDQAGRSDNLEDTINYADVYARVKAIVEGRAYKLIEALAERVAEDLLQTYTSINELTVRVVKPHPPFAIFFDGVTVEIHRKRSER